MAAMSGFFNNALTKDNKQEKANLYINVGGEQFHAMAAALVDYFKYSVRGNETAIKKILEQLYTSYPKYLLNQPYLTLSERMTMLVKQSRTSEVVECLSDVLRQITVDELYLHPLEYREVYKALSPQCSKDYFRQPTTKLPLESFKALSSALGLTIHCSIVEPGKELRKKIVFSSRDGEASKFEVALQVQGDTYFPEVKNKLDFAYVGQLAISVPKSVERKDNKEDTIADILNLIAKDNKRLSVLFEQNLRTLLSMVSAGELSKSQLIKLYIDFLPSELGSSSDCMGIFSAIQHADKKPFNSGSSVDADEQVTMMLSETLAAYLTTGQIDKDQFYSCIENLEAKKATVPVS